MKNDLVLLTHEVEKKIGKKIHVGSDLKISFYLLCETSSQGECTGTAQGVGICEW